jgi:nitrite reductase (NADH) small subunit
MATKWFKVATVDSVPPQEGRRVYFKAWEFAIFHLGNGQFKAMDNRCPHKQGPLADGLVAGEAVFCPLHNWKISLKTGCALTNGPGQVRVYPTKVMGTDVYAALNDGQYFPCEESTNGASGGAENNMKVANQ